MITVDVLDTLNLDDIKEFIKFHSGLDVDKLDKFLLSPKEQDKQFKGEQPYVMIAGGVLLDFLLEQTPKDIDIFTSSTTLDEQLIDHLKDLGFKVTFNSPQVITMKLVDEANFMAPIQIILRPERKYQSPQELLSSFPFAVTAIGYNLLTQQISRTKAFEQSVEFEYIEYGDINKTNCISAIPRLIKYSRKTGFLPSKRAIEAIVYVIRNMSEEDLHSELDYVMTKDSNTAGGLY